MFASIAGRKRRLHRLHQSCLTSQPTCLSVFCFASQNVKLTSFLSIHSKPQSWVSHATLVTSDPPLAPSVPTTVRRARYIIPEKYNRKPVSISEPCHCVLRTMSPSGTYVLTSFNREEARFRSWPPACADPYWCQAYPRRAHPRWQPQVPCPASR